MSEWQFWDDGIMGIICILMGMFSIYAGFCSLPNKYKREGLAADKIKKKCRLFKIFALVLILFGILTLIGYLTV